MKKPRTLKLALLMSVLGLMVQACGPKVPNAEAPCGFAQNSYGERVSWKKTVPVTLFIDESVPDEFRKVIQSAMDQWAQQAGRPLFRIGGVMAARSPGKDGVSAIYWRTSWDEDKPYEQGRTNISWRGNVLTEADVLINAKDFTYYDQQYVSNSVHLESLLFHELGHALGLSHIEGEHQHESVMNPYLRKNTVRLELGSIDQETLKCEYI